MKFQELELVHHHKNKFIRRYRLRAKNKIVTIGSSHETDIRLLGDDVSLIHAYIEYQNENWFLIDASSQQGTWVQKKPITSEPLSSDTVVSIGGHQLKLIPKTIEKEVFSPTALRGESNTGPQVYQQVVIFNKGKVVHSELLPADSPYAFYCDGKTQTLPPPQSQEVKETQLAGFTVYQRLVRSGRLEFSQKNLWAEFKNPEFRAPLGATLVLLFLIAVLILAIPKKPQQELADLNPNNKYNRLVLDGEMMKKKRAEAKEMRKTMMARSPKIEQPKNTLMTPVRSKGAAPKVISKLKLDGLTKLLGKISQRANSKGPMLVAIGRPADDPNTGSVTTVAAVGSLQGVATGRAGNSGETYKVGGVGTFGKGGGHSRDLAGVGGLAAGAAGAGTVGILEEETEIEGGLDKEVIAKAISAYLGEIRYCYERQLSAEPDLYGKVQVKFTIDGQGNVSEHRIGSTTLKSAMVEGCILRRLARWKFPKPKGGTHVLVTYPFMFKATN